MAQERISKFSLLKRRADLTHEEFDSHWLRNHGPLVASIPAFWKHHSTYIQNHTYATPSSMGTNPRWDGVAQFILRDHGDTSTKDFFDEPSYESTARPDDERFLSLPDCTALVCREHVIKDGPRTKYKYMGFLRPVDGFTVESFQEYWLRNHARVVRECAPFWGRIRRYVQNHGIPERYRGLSGQGEKEDFVGVAEIWFDSLEDIETAFTEREYLRCVRPDEGVFIRKPTTRFLVEEVTVDMPQGMKR